MDEAPDSVVAESASDMDRLERLITVEDRARVGDKPAASAPKKEPRRVRRDGDATVLA